MRATERKLGHGQELEVRTCGPVSRCVARSESGLQLPECHAARSGNSVVGENRKWEKQTRTEGRSRSRQLRTGSCCSKLGVGNADEAESHGPEAGSRTRAESQNFRSLRPAAHPAAEVDYSSQSATRLLEGRERRSGSCGQKTGRAGADRKLSPKRRGGVRCERQTGSGTQRQRGSQEQPKRLTGTGSS